MVERPADVVVAAADHAAGIHSYSVLSSCLILVCKRQVTQHRFKPFQSISEWIEISKGSLDGPNAATKAINIKRWRLYIRSYIIQLTPFSPTPDTIVCLEYSLVCTPIPHQHHRTHLFARHLSIHAFIFTVNWVFDLFLSSSFFRVVCSVLLFFWTNLDGNNFSESAMERYAPNVCSYTWGIFPSINLRN